MARSRVVEIWNRLLVWNQSRGAPNQRVGAPGDQLQPYGADGLMEDRPLSWVLTTATVAAVAAPATITPAITA